MTADEIEERIAQILAQETKTQQDWKEYGKLLEELLDKYTVITVKKAK